MASGASSSFPAAPWLLIPPHGAPVFGNFSGAPEHLGLENIDYRGLGRPPWSWTRAFGARLLKRWQFVGAVDEDLVVGAAVAHVQYLATAFAYVFDRRTGEVVEQSLKVPMALGAEFSQSPSRGETRLRLGARYVSMDNDVRGGERCLDVELGDALGIHLRYREEGVGMSTACPHETGGLHYTYKFAGLPVDGEVRVGDRRIRLRDDALALLDWTASTPPRATTWNWSCAVGQGGKGRRLAINFSQGLVGGPYSQNAVWLEGIPHLLGPVTFGYDPAAIVTKPWRLTTADGAVDLTFHPDAERFEDIDLKLVASRLHQPFGRFEGRIRAGEEEVDASLFGFCEEHYAKW